MCGPFTVRINCFSDLNYFTNGRRSRICKKNSKSLEHFFLKQKTVWTVNDGPGKDPAGSLKYKGFFFPFRNHWRSPRNVFQFDLIYFVFLKFVNFSDCALENNDENLRVKPRSFVFPEADQEGLNIFCYVDVPLPKVCNVPYIFAFSKGFLFLVWTYLEKSNVSLV